MTLQCTWHLAWLNYPFSAQAGDLSKIRQNHPKVKKTKDFLSELNTIYLILITASYDYRLLSSPRPYPRKQRRPHPRPTTWHAFAARDRGIYCRLSATA